VITDSLKPYGAYKDSGVPWLGEVPEHWRVADLGRYIRVQSGDMITIEDERDAGIPIYGGNGIRGYTFKANTNGPVILLGRVGAKCGCVHLVNGRLWASEHALRVLPRVAVNLEFFACLLDHADLNRYAIRTAQPLINSTIVRSHRVALPSDSEQVAIVRFLRHVDRRIRRYIRAKKKLIALLNEQKQAIIHHVVTRGLDPNVRLKPSGVEWLADVPENWEVRPAKYFYREVDERSRTGEEELLSVSHITGVTPRSQKSITMFMASSYIGHKLCRPGELVINTMWAWMGALGVAKEMGIVSPSYGVYRPVRNSQLLGDYVDLLLRTRPYVSEYTCRSTGIRSSRLRLYPEQFLRIKLVCPSAEEQRAILDCVAAETTATERAMGSTQREIDLLREYRTRLIADVVTGKVDVREAAVRLPEETEEPEPLDEADALAEGDGDTEDADLEAATEEAEA